MCSCARREQLQSAVSRKRMARLVGLVRCAPCFCEAGSDFRMVVRAFINCRFYWFVAAKITISFLTAKRKTLFPVSRWQFCLRKCVSAPTDLHFSRQKSALDSVAGISHGRKALSTQSRAFLTAEKRSRLSRGHFSRQKSALDSVAGISHG